MPVVREELRVAKRSVETGRVRVVKRVREEEQLVERPLLNEEVEVRRVSVEQFVDDAPLVRQEGETLIVPIVEEVLVVEKRLMLKEELHIRKRTISKPFSQRVTVRVEEAAVQRLDPTSPQSTRPPRK
ncbi:MAG TPA: YsnF/AvaK domain-containing protein [Tepidisphaeraceae bacterium]|nr:YsnF/AvaK domain-containing protein [Tepidisphaeraceae bacterium]